MIFYLLIKNVNLRNRFFFKSRGIAVFRKKFSLKWYKMCYCTTRIKETYLIQRLTKLMTNLT